MKCAYLESRSTNTKMVDLPIKFGKPSTKSIYIYIYILDHTLVGIGRVEKFSWTGAFLLVSLAHIAMPDIVLYLSLHSHPIKN